MINRNNYEEYFLLLADNELSAEEAIAVKQFAAQHPDLAEELNILLSCRLDDMVMPVYPKEKLLRPTHWNAEHPEPAQTQLLLLLDGELPLTAKNKIEKGIAASPALQKEWQLLQQTKLAAETISHPNKESLLRDRHKVRPLLWMRWATAAAVVAGLGWFLWAQYEPQQVMSSATVASNTLPEQKVFPTVPTDVQPQPGLVQIVPTQTEEATSNPPIMHTAVAHHKADETTNKTATYLAASNNGVVSTNPNIQNNATESEPVVARLSSTSISPDMFEAEPIQVARLSTRAVALPVLATSQKFESFTGNKSSLTAEEDDYVTVGGAHVSKQKMRGLFRNVTRTVARTFTKSKMEPDVYVTR